MQENQFNYYRNNRAYTNFLDKGKLDTFDVYTNILLKYSKKGDKVLDVGCGTGLVVDYLVGRGRRATGLDISQTSISLAKSKYRGKYYTYNENNFPFPDNTFTITGSFNVIEHVSDVIGFLSECVRVTAAGGYLVICCPNFISVTNSYHYRTSGLVRKVKNSIIFFQKLANYFLGSGVEFQKFNPIIRKNFSPDDDAVNLVNPIDLLKWGKLNKLKLVFHSGYILPFPIPRFIGTIPGLNLLSGGITIVFIKSDL